VRLPRLLSAALLVWTISSVAAPAFAQGTNASGAWIRQLAETDATERAIPFGHVIESVTGRRVLPFESTNAVDAAVARQLGLAFGRVLERMNATNSPLRALKRINEASRHFENALREEIDRAEDLRCRVPETAEGRAQRAGYPDLRIVHGPTGRVFYLDPKLLGPGTRGSSLRTFYYEPRIATNKVQDDAVHLLVGFEHDGAEAGRWTFARWELVDLSALSVELKAEFNASNRDLYRAAHVVGRSPESGEKKTGAP
jgi:hypothetical protein